MNKTDVMSIITISNKIKKMWDYMLIIEDYINKRNTSLLEPLFRKFIETGYNINDIVININEYIDFESINSIEFFDDIMYMIIRLDYLIEKNIYLISKIILMVFKDFKKNCEQVSYWRHESYLRIKFDVYSM